MVVDIGEVERRILAQQHDVDAGEIDEPRLAEASRGRPRRPCTVSGSAIVATREPVEPQPIGGVMEQAMAARLRLEQQREGRIAGDADALDRVHLHGDGQGHGGPQSEGEAERRGINRSPAYTRRGVAGKPAGGDEHGVASQGQARRPRVAREPDARGAGDAPALRRADRLGGGIEIAARLDLDEGDRAAAPRDEIDFAAGYRETSRENR